MDKSKIFSYISSSNFNNENPISENIYSSDSKIKPLEIINKPKKRPRKYISDKKSKLKFSVLNGNEKRKIKRKNKEDNIRKKLKTHFHNYIRKNININLLKVGSKRLFENFPQSFIADISRKTNNEVMKLTYGELFEYIKRKLYEENNLIKEEYQKKRIKAGKNKVLKNIETLRYLESNKEISEKSGWEIMKNKKYVDLLKDYFNSKEFEQSIIGLNKKENQHYIKNYQFFAKNYVEYFLSYKPDEINKKNRKPNNKQKNKQNSNINNIINLIINDNCENTNSPKISSHFSMNEENNSLEKYIYLIYGDIEDESNTIFSKNSLFSEGE